MPNLEKQKVQVTCGQTDICSSEMEINELRAIFKQFEEEKGATHCYFGESTDRCGDHESYYIEFYKFREENDDEYNRRIAREVEQEKERAEAARKKAEKEADPDYQKYLELSRKYDKGFSYHSNV